VPSICSRNSSSCGRMRPDPLHRGCLQASRSLSPSRSLRRPLRLWAARHPREVRGCHKRARLLAGGRPHSPPGCCCGLGGLLSVLPSRTITRSSTVVATSRTPLWQQSVLVAATRQQVPLIPHRLAGAAFTSMPAAIRLAACRQPAAGGSQCARRSPPERIEHTEIPRECRARSCFQRRSATLIRRRTGKLLPALLEAGPTQPCSIPLCPSRAALHWLPAWLSSWPRAN